MALIKHAAAYALMGVLVALYLADAYITASMRVGG